MAAGSSQPGSNPTCLRLLLLRTCAPPGPQAERSAYSWQGDEAAIRGSGHNVHLLPNSGHW